MNRKARRMASAVKRGKKTLTGNPPGMEPQAKRIRVQTIQSLGALHSAVHQALYKKEAHHG